MRAALLAVADGIGLTWRFSRALVRAGVAGAIGMARGFVVFAILGLLAPKDWGVSIWTSGILLSGVVGAISTFLDLTRRPAPPDVMGSAAWAGVREVAADLAVPAFALDASVLLVGRGAGRSGAALRYTGPAHLLTVAPTRSGKGVGTVLPNLLAAPRSVVCVDSKGENSRIAARARRRFGPVWVLDPFGASGQPAAAYDPAGSLDPLSPDLADAAATPPRRWRTPSSSTRRARSRRPTGTRRPRRSPPGC